MSNKKYRTNVRAISNEELIQIISESEGIYESTLVNLLQCNKITLHTRLKTMMDNQLISKKRLGKNFLYTNNYNVKNIMDLDLQTNAVQNISKKLFNLSNIKVITNEKYEKQLFGTFYTFPRSILVDDNNLRSSFHEYHENIEHAELSDYFYELCTSFITKFKIKFSNIDEYTILDYANFDSKILEVLAVENRAQLGEVKSKLDRIDYFDEFNENQTSIRDTILVYVNEEDTLLKFEFDELRLGSYGYKEVEIENTIDLLYLVSLTWYSHIFTSNDLQDKDILNYLYAKSLQNRKKFNIQSLK